VARKAEEFSEEFKEFWKFWPGRWKAESDKTVKVGKYDAWLEWKRLSKETQDLILKIVKSGIVKKRGTQFLPDAHRWLKKKRWYDFM